MRASLTQSLRLMDESLWPVLENGSDVFITKESVPKGHCKLELQSDCSRDINSLLTGALRYIRLHLHFAILHT